MTIETLAWVLVHSTWQGTVVAALTEVQLHRLHDAPAGARHRVAWLGLVAAVVLPVATVLLPGTGPGPTLELTTSLGPPPAPAWATWLVAAWGLGVLAVGASTALGLWSLDRRRRRSIAPPPALAAAFAQWCARLDVSAELRLVAAGATPIVVGALRPAVLFPASLLVKLPPSQVEALLVHELCHVRRWDVAANQVLAVVETVGFYHPAVWWLTRRIRHERELCCDADAVALLGDRLMYARALAELELARAGRLAPAGAGGRLMERIRRVVGEPTGPERTRWAAPALVVALFATGALLGPPAQATTDADAFVVPSPPEVDEVSEMAPPPPPAPVVDAVPPPPPPVAAAPPTPPPPPASLRAFAVPAPPTPPVVVVPTVPFHTEPLFFSDDGVAAADPAPEAEERPLSIEDVGARALQALADQLDSGAKNLEERAERRWRKKQQRGAADVHVQRHDHQVVIRLGDDTIHHAQGDEGCTTYTAPGARVTVCGDGDVLAIRDDLDDEIGNGFEWSFDLGEFFGNGWSNHVQSLDRNTQVEVRRALEEAQREMDAAQREIEQAMEQARAAREEALQRAHHDRERALEEAERARELRRRLRAQRG